MPPGLLTPVHTALEIVVRCTAVYLLVLLLLRLMGKREVGQMNTVDFVMLLLIANAVQNAMTGPDTSLVGGAVAAATLIGINFVLSHTLLKHARLRKLVEGSPTLLIHDGQILQDHLRSEGITQEALEAALREHGVARAADCSSAILEVDGSISVLKPDDIKNNTGRTHRRIRFLQRPH
ncbi:MAG: DUF421 domain-containing protein [Terriglobales bacterium]